MPHIAYAIGMGNIKGYVPMYAGQTHPQDTALLKAQP